MRKISLRDIVIVLLLLAAASWLMYKLNKLPSLSNIFSSKPVVIDRTPIIIKEIKTIAQLVTVTSYDEVVVDSLVYNKTAAFVDAFRAVSPLALLPSLQKQLVIIARGKVLAGTNLQHLDSSHITISNDTLQVSIPHAQIIEAIINPADFETFEERGVWSDAEVTALKLQAKNKMTQRALQQNILSKADTKAAEILTTFLGNTGFKEVTVSFQ